MTDAEAVRIVAAVTHREHEVPTVMLMLEYMLLANPPAYAEFVEALHGTAERVTACMCGVPES